MSYWLMKSEPMTFSIDDLKKEKKTSWEGVRNYEARNLMRDEMKTGDLIFFYHSNVEIPGIVGLAKVYKESHPDPTQWDKLSQYYDGKSSSENPRWFMVGIEFVKKFSKCISLQDLKAQKGLSNLSVVKKGSRLSVSPVGAPEAKIILKLSEEND